MNKKKTQTDELELYDGRRASLTEKQVLTDHIPSLAVTARGKETFALSESLYCKWLETGQDPSLIDRAVALCREAVALGYPQAVVKMGFYYDKDYVDADRTEEYRCRVATDYYGKVVYSDKYPTVEKVINPVTGASESVRLEIAWEDLQKTAARMLLEMLAASEYANSCDSDDSYGYAHNAERIKSAFGIELKNVSVPFRGKDNEKTLKQVLEACRYNKYRAPLFGVIRLDYEEAKRIFSKEGFGWSASKNVNIWLINGSAVVKAGPTEGFIKKFSGFPHDKVWVCFFNSNLGGHRFLKEKSRREICERFYAKDCEVFKELIGGAELRKRHALLFSDDDVRFYMNGRFDSLRAAMELVESVTKLKDR